MPFSAVETASGIAVLLQHPYEPCGRPVRLRYLEQLPPLAFRAEQTVEHRFAQTERDLLPVMERFGKSFFDEVAYPTPLESAFLAYLGLKSLIVLQGENGSLLATGHHVVGDLAVAVIPLGIE